jgi:guanylate kinase
VKAPMIFVFSGPSGSGKTTLIEGVLDKFKSIMDLSVSCTTRQPRIGEIDSIHYHFISNEKFRTLIEEGKFIEYTKCYDNMYGTLRDAVYCILKNKNYCILNVDYNGAREVLQNKCFNNIASVGILILPSSIKCMKERLINRKSETEKSLNIRLSAAFNHSRMPNFKHVIINKDFKQAVNELYSVINSYVQMINLP